MRIDSRGESQLRVDGVLAVRMKVGLRPGNDVDRLVAEQIENQGDEVRGCVEQKLDFEI